MRALKDSFNAGVFTPRLWSRYELSKFRNGNKTLTNFVCTPHGPAMRRPGTEYIAEVKTSSSYTRLLPFEFSEQDAYIIEAGNLYNRFYRNGGQIQTVDSDTKLLLHLNGERLSTTITDDGDTGHTCTANGDAKLETFLRKFGSASCYFNGVDGYISVPDHADFNFGSSTFTVDMWVYRTGGSGIETLFSQNDSGGAYYRCTYNAGTGTIFFGFYGGAVYEISVTASSVTLSDSTWHHIAVVRGWGGNANDWAITVDGSSVATETDSTTIDDMDGTFQVGAANAALHFTGYIDEVRVSSTARWTANFEPPSSEYPGGDDSGTTYELVTTYTQASLPSLHYVQSADTMYIVHKDFVVRQLVRSDHASWAISDVTFTNAPAAWSANDYPRTIEFHEDRLCFGGSPDQPDTIWMTDTGDYVTFTAGGADDAAVTMTLAARRVNDIKWLSSGRRLIIGTQGEEWWAAGPSDTEPIQTDSKVAKRDSTWGSTNIRPVNIGDTVFYVQQNGKIIREMKYDFGLDKYVSANTIILSDHLTEDYTITDIAYQQHPYQILWCIRSDGGVIAMTYMAEQEVVGWHLHTSGSGQFESVAVIPGNDEDEVWFIVKRTIDGSEVRYIERLKPFNYGTALEDAFFMDSGLTYNGPATTTISGLDHLEGEAVQVLADGVVVTGKTVSSGSITLDSAASKVHVGLANTPELETLDIYREDEVGPVVGYEQRITNVKFSLVDSMGGQYGPDSSTTQDIEYRDETEPFTGWTEDMGFNEGFDNTSTVYVTSNEPLPLQVAAISIDLEEG